MPRYDFLIGFPITIKNAWDTQLNFGWEPGNDKQKYVVSISVSRDNGKITRKDFKIITATTVWWNVTEKWILKKGILTVQQEKIMDF